MYSLFFNKYILGALGIVGIVGGLFYWGYHTSSERYAAAQAQIEADQKLQQVLIAQRDEVHVQEVVKWQTLYKTKLQEVNHDVEKIVERPVYTNVCFDPDGLRAANEALNPSPTPQGTNGAVPAPNPAK